MNEHTQQPPPPKKGGRCFLYGCGTLLIIGLVLVLMAYLGYRKLNKVLDQYLAKEPMDLPALTFTEEQKGRMQLRLREFGETLHPGNPVPPLTLSSEDLNLLLASTERFRALGESVRLRIEDGEVKGQISLRFGDLGAPVLQDRYLNGEASFDVSLRDGSLVVIADELTVNGQQLPEEYQTAIRNENLAQAANDNPDFAAAMEKLDRIEVEGSTLTIVPK